MARFGAGQKWVWDDGQAGPCMGGAWHRCWLGGRGRGLFGVGIIF